MADNSRFNSTVESLFSGMDNFVSAKTVVGDAVTVNDTIIVPLVDVAFGVGAGAFAGDTKNNAGGGLGAKLSPSAVLVIQNGQTRLVNVNMVGKIAGIAGGRKNKNDDAVDEAIKDMTE